MFHQNSWLTHKQRAIHLPVAGFFRSFWDTDSKQNQKEKTDPQRTINDNVARSASYTESHKSHAAKRKKDRSLGRKINIGAYMHCTMHGNTFASFISAVRLCTLCVLFSSYISFVFLFLGIFTFLLFGYSSCLVLRSFHRRRARGEQKFFFVVCFVLVFFGFVLPRFEVYKQQRAELSRAGHPDRGLWHGITNISAAYTFQHTCDMRNKILLGWRVAWWHNGRKWAKESDREREGARKRGRDRAAGKPEHKSQIRLMFIKTSEQDATTTTTTSMPQLFFFAFFISFVSFVLFCGYEIVVNILVYGQATTTVTT